MATVSPMTRVVRWLSPRLRRRRAVVSRLSTHDLTACSTTRAQLKLHLADPTSYDLGIAIGELARRGIDARPSPEELLDLLTSADDPRYYRGVLLFEAAYPDYAHPPGDGWSNGDPPEAWRAGGADSSARPRITTHCNGPAGRNGPPDSTRPSAARPAVECWSVIRLGSRNERRQPRTYRPGAASRPVDAGIRQPRRGRVSAPARRSRGHALEVRLRLREHPLPASQSSQLPPGVHPIADFVFGEGDSLSGIFVYEKDGILSGLEVYGSAGDAPKSLPRPEELRPFAGSTAG